MRPFVLFALVGAVSLAKPASGQGLPHESRVVIRSGEWELVGDLVLPVSEQPVPAVLMLNGAARDRHAYDELALELARRGLASLRLDLRGHGESTNQGRFAPGAEPRSPLIWDSETDVHAALRFLRGYAGIDADRLGVVGASYSGEEMAEAGRRFGYVQAYVALSPGSFSEASIAGIDESTVPWLLVVSRDERHLGEIAAAVQAESERVHLEVLPGTEHADRLLALHRGLAERVAVWLSAHLLDEAERGSNRQRE